MWSLPPLVSDFFNTFRFLNDTVQKYCFWRIKMQLNSVASVASQVAHNAENALQVTPKSVAQTNSYFQKFKASLQSVKASLETIPEEHVRPIWNGLVTEIHGGHTIKCEPYKYNEEGETLPLEYVYSEKVIEIAKRWKTPDTATVAVVCECLYRQGVDLDKITTLDPKLIYIHRSQPKKFVEQISGQAYLMGGKHNCYRAQPLSLEDRLNNYMERSMSVDDIKRVRDSIRYKYIANPYYGDGSCSSPVYRIYITEESSHFYLEAILSLKESIYNPYTAYYEKKGEYSRLRCTLADILEIGIKVYMSEERQWNSYSAPVEAITLRLDEGENLPVFVLD